MNPFDRTPITYQNPTPITQRGLECSSSGAEDHQTFSQRLLTVEPSEKADSPPPVTVAPKDPNKAFFEDVAARFDTPLVNTRVSMRTSRPESATSQTVSPQTSEPSLVTGLRGNYAGIATDLYVTAAAQLAELQSSLETQIAQLRATDAAFLSTLTKQHAELSRPLSDACCKLIITDKRTGRSRTEVVSIGERIAQFRARVNAIEAEVDSIWDEWEAADAEVQSIAQEIFSREADDTSGSVVHSFFAEFRGEVEQDLEAVAAEVVDKMKASEKEFKRTIFAEQDKLAQAVMSQRSRYD